MKNNTEKFVTPPKNKAEKKNDSAFKNQNTVFMDVIPLNVHFPVLIEKSS